MRRNILLLTVFVSSLCSGSPGVATAAGWQAGVAKVNISPELPIWLSGYAVRNRPAATKHDDLWAKALVMEDAAGHRAVLVTMDLVGIPRDLSEAVCKQVEERYKFPRPAIALCASHTHSGPVVRGNLMAMYSLDEDQSRRVKEYKAALIDKLVSVVGEAMKTMKPAKLSWGIGEAGFAVNRRNNKPESKVADLRKENKLVGPVDHELPVLAVYGEDDQLRAIVGGYACHATVLGLYFVTGDWPGAGQNELERRHPGATAMFVAGCGGDQNPLPRGSLEFVAEYGKEFADGVDATLKSLKPLAPSLKTAYEQIDLAFDTAPTRAEFEAMVNEPKPKGPWAKYMLSQWDRDGKLPTTYPYPVQAWRLGDDLTWILLGGEVVVDYSLRLKSELGPKKTWVSSYSNDVMGYIPSLRVLREGKYEGGEARFPYGLPAPWAPPVEEQIVKEVHTLAERVAK